MVKSNSPNVPDVVSYILKSAIFIKCDHENQQYFENLDHLKAEDFANFHTVLGAGSTSTVDRIRSDVVTVVTFMTMIEHEISSSKVPATERNSIVKFSVAA